MAFNKEKVMEAARKFVEKGQIDKAVKEYLRIVKEDPQEVRVWLKIGDLYARKGQKQDATETYLKVARYYQDQGFFTKAVAVYKQILKLDPRLVEVHLKLAELYRQLGLMSEAMIHFESVASHFHREGKTKEALSTVRQLVELDQQNVAMRIKLAELYSTEGMTEEAVAEFGLVCEQLRRQNRQDDFIKVAERLLWHRPDNRELNRELAGLYLRRSDPRRALQKLQICFKADPRDVDTLVLLAQAFQALDQKGKTVSVLKELARVFDDNKQRSRAEEVYRKILGFAPADPDAVQYLRGVSPAHRTPVPAPPPSAESRSSSARPAGIRWTTEIPVAVPGDPKSAGATSLMDDQDLSRDFPSSSSTTEISLESVAYADEVSGEHSAAVIVSDFTAELGGEARRRDSSAAGEAHAEEIAKILTEADVYVKYGLHQKAIDHLRRIFSLDRDNLEARERLKDVLLSQGRESEAIAELLYLAELVAPHDVARAEAYVREILGVDGANQAAFELTERFGLDISAASDAEALDGTNELFIDPDEISAGAVAAIEEDIDFDDLDFGDPLQAPAAPGQRADLLGVGRAARPASPRSGFASDHQIRVSDQGDFGDHVEPTRQVDPAEVELLLARVNRAQDDDLDAGAMGSPPPFPANISPDTEPRSLSDALDDALDDDSLGDNIDQEVAAELRAVTGYADGFDPGGTDRIHPVSDDELPFDREAAREFDAATRPLATDPETAVGQPLLDDIDEISFDDQDGTADHALEPFDDLASASRTVEDQLEDADYFAGQGLIEQAVAVLRGLDARYPGHPLVTARLRDLDGQVPIPAGSTSEVSLEAIEGEEVALAATDGTDTVDIDEIEEVEFPGGLDSLTDELGAAFHDAQQPSAPEPETQKPAPRRAVLLENPVEETDDETHFDLGMAYKEMGLYDEAIRAFQKSFQSSPDREVQSRMMIGLCHREQGVPAEAVLQFKAGLHAAVITERERQTLLYEIGASYDQLGDSLEAIYYFEMVVKRDPGFLDASDRLAALRAGRNARRVAADEVGDGLELQLDDPSS